MRKWLLPFVLLLCPLLGAAGSCQKCEPCAAGWTRSGSSCVCLPPVVPAGTGGNLSTGGAASTDAGIPDASPPPVPDASAPVVVMPECLDPAAMRALPAPPGPSVLGWVPPKGAPGGVRIQRDERAIDRLTTAGPVFWAPNDLQNIVQEVGSCAASGANQCLAFAPFAGHASQITALAWYHEATLIDGITGVYPPNDTGTTLDAVWRVLLKKAMVKSVRTCQTLEELRAGLQTGPGEIGVRWFERMFTPDRCGQVLPLGTIQGGHGFAVVGDDPWAKLIWARNTWPRWGVNRRGPGGLETGYFSLSWDTVQRLASLGWECIFPQPP